MPKRALIDKRPILLASMAAALAFFVLRQSPVVPELWLIPLKGLGVGLLALYALLRHRGTDAKILAAMFVLAALGDMAIEIDRMAGAILFFAYHMVAIGLYLRHPRETSTGSQKATAVAMLLLTPAIFWLLPADRGEAWPTALYGLALGGMAACAWLSAFSRYRVGVRLSARWPRVARLPEEPRSTAPEPSLQAHRTASGAARMSRQAPGEPSRPPLSRQSATTR
jgi:uncharacterized membrane protein YhhN